MPNETPFKEYTLNSFDEFEEQYRVILNNRPLYHAVYRGQSDSSWGLIPTIFRDYPKEIDNPKEWITERIKQEFLDVQYFVKVADKTGFNFPLSGELLDLINAKGLSEDVSGHFNFWIWYKTESNFFHEVMTIAQHHGVGTRFIDFSFDAYVALYFSAEGAVETLINNLDEIDNKKYFSLWLIDRIYLVMDECRIKHYEIPVARNKYLLAQKGLFLQPPLPTRFDNVLKSEFDIKEIAVKNSNEVANASPTEAFKSRWPVIYKFNFPYKIAPEIIRELDDKKDIRLTTVKPNLDNIVKYRNFREKVNNLWGELQKR